MLAEAILSPKSKSIQQRGNGFRCELTDSKYFVVKISLCEGMTHVLTLKIVTKHHFALDMVIFLTFRKKAIYSHSSTKNEMLSICGVSLQENDDNSIHTSATFVRSVFLEKHELISFLLEQIIDYMFGCIEWRF